MAQADRPAAGYLDAIGAAVRAQRERRGWTRRELAEASGVSERFLGLLEGGAGNISLVRFAEVAHALGTTPSVLLAAADAQTADGATARPIALLGVRGAGKSTVGALLAKKLAVPFVELDQEIEAAAGLALADVFAVHGEAYYRRVEREVLTRLLAANQPMVLATGGSIVNDPATFALLRARCTTVWLRARPEDHWNRVVAQGDQRPMAENPHAFSELRGLLAARENLYARAEHAIDTAGTRPHQVVTAVVGAVGAIAVASAASARLPKLTPAPARAIRSGSTGTAGAADGRTASARRARPSSSRA